MHVRRSIPFLLVVTSLYCSLAEERQAKRGVPSGFTGVRGKKSIAAGAYQDDDRDDQDDRDDSSSSSSPHSVDKRVPSMGFMGMRGKKPFGNDFYSGGLPWAGTYPAAAAEAMIKRVPSGFMGMRGKKEMELVGYDDYLKRAPSGFMGMRGKKELDDMYAKRAPMGFVGMRGKKDAADIEYYANDDDKRAPQGFFGMRGKKLQQRMSGFFGMRGKKYPYEFRGKFVGVRGKKSLYDELPAAAMYRNWYYGRPEQQQQMDMDQLLLLLLTERNDGHFPADNLLDDDVETADAAGEN